MAEAREEKRSNNRADDRETGYSIDPQVLLKVVLTLVLVVLAGARLFFYEKVKEPMDLVFLALFISVFLLWMIPWEDLWRRLQSVSVGGVGISMEHSTVQAAIGTISIEQENLEIIGSSNSKEVRDRLRRQLKSLEGELQTVRGSRVLWIDDHPHTVLGERRLLRALGIDVTSASSSERAAEILKEDDDFDLLITDVQRPGTSHEFVPSGVQIHEGVNYVVKLRTAGESDRIKSLPVIFYAAYPWNRLSEFTRPARELPTDPEIPEPEISNSIDKFIPKVIRSLSDERVHPIEVSAKKTMTGLRRSS